MRQGELSYCKVRALTRVATAGNEQTLLDIARSVTGGQLEVICRLYRGAVDDQLSPEALAAKERELQYRREIRVQHNPGTGTVVLRVEMPADEGHRVLRRLESVQAGLDRGGDAGGARDESADAKVRGGYSLMDAFLHVVDGGAVRERVEVRLHASLADLRGNGDGAVNGGEGEGESEGGAGAHLDHQTGVSRACALRFACDAAWVPVLEHADGETSSGRRRRCIAPLMRRALELRDEGQCRFPGCHHHHHIEAHHVEHWIDGGETTLDNLISLCRGHHRALHEGGCSIGLDEHGHFQFKDVHGRILADATPRPALVGDGVAVLDRRLRETGVHVSAESSACGWDGDRVDLAYVVDELMYVSDASRVRLSTS